MNKSNEKRTHTYRWIDNKKKAAQKRCLLFGKIFVARIVLEIELKLEIVNVFSLKVRKTTP